MYIKHFIDLFFSEDVNRNTLLYLIKENKIQAETQDYLLSQISSNQHLPLRLILLDAIMLYYGLSMTKNCNLSIEILKEKIEAYKCRNDLDYTDLIFALGFLYADEKELLIDSTETILKSDIAQQLLLKAIKHNNPSAMHELGWLSYKQSKTDSAIRYFIQAAHNGYSQSMFFLSKLYLKKQNKPELISKGLILLQTAADSLNLDALSIIGYHLEKDLIENIKKDKLSKSDIQAQYNNIVNYHKQYLNLKTLSNNHYSNTIKLAELYINPVIHDNIQQINYPDASTLLRQASEKDQTTADLAITKLIAIKNKQNQFNLVIYYNLIYVLIKQNSPLLEQELNQFYDELSIYLQNVLYDIKLLDSNQLRILLHSILDIDRHVYKDTPEQIVKNTIHTTLLEWLQQKNSIVSNLIINYSLSQKPLEIEKNIEIVGRLINQLRTKKALYQYQNIQQSALQIGKWGEILDTILDDARSDIFLYHDIDLQGMNILDPKKTTSPIITITLIKNYLTTNNTMLKEYLCHTLSQTLSLQSNNLDELIDCLSAIQMQLINAPQPKPIKQQKVIRPYIKSYIQYFFEYRNIQLIEYLLDPQHPPLKTDEKDSLLEKINFMKKVNRHIYLLALLEATLYFTGEIVIQDTEKAINILTQFIESENLNQTHTDNHISNVMAYLGYFHTHTNITNKYSIAQTWYLKAIQANNANAMYFLYLLYENNFIQPPNEENISEVKQSLLENASINNNSDAILKLAIQNMSAKNYQRAYDLFSQARWLKNYRAMYAFAFKCESINSDMFKEALAKKLYKEAIKFDCKKSMHNLANLLYIKDPVKNKDRIVELCLDAIELGNTRCMLWFAEKLIRNFTEIQIEGKSGYNAAAILCRKAHDLGDNQAINQLRRYHPLTANLIDNLTDTEYHYIVMSNRLQIFIKNPSTKIDKLLMQQIMPHQDLELLFSYMKEDDCTNVLNIWQNYMFKMFKEALDAPINKEINYIELITKILDITKLNYIKPHPELINKTTAYLATKTSQCARFLEHYLTHFDTNKLIQAIIEENIEIITYLHNEVQHNLYEIEICQLKKHTLFTRDFVPRIESFGKFGNTEIRAIKYEWRENFNNLMLIIHERFLNKSISSFDIDEICFLDTINETSDLRVLQILINYFSSPTISPIKDYLTQNREVAGELNLRQIFLQKSQSEDRIAFFTPEPMHRLLNKWQQLQNELYQLILAQKIQPDTNSDNEEEYEEISCKRTKLN